jgi:hypothetical protein
MLLQRFPRKATVVQGICVLRQRARARVGFNLVVFSELIIHAGYVCTDPQF